VRVKSAGPRAWQCNCRSSKAEIEDTFKPSIDAFFEMYPAIRERFRFTVRVQLRGIRYARCLAYRSVASPYRFPKFSGSSFGIAEMSLSEHG